MSSKDKKARLRFMEEFDKVVQGGNKTVTARTKFLAGLIGVSGGTVQQAIYMGKNLVHDEVAIVHARLQEENVQERITEEGNEGFLDPSLWLPIEDRANWRKVLEEGGTLPSGGRKKTGRRKNSTRQTQGKATQKRTQSKKQSKKATKKRKSAKRTNKSLAAQPHEVSEKRLGSTKVILETPDGTELKLNLTMGQNVRIRFNPETQAGWEISF